MLRYRLTEWQRSPPMPDEVVRITGPNTLTRMLLHEGIEYTEEEWNRKLLNDRLDRIIA
jgi:hypothetical protein